MAVHYEWDVEEIEDGEVVEHNHVASYRDAKTLAVALCEGVDVAIVLVRDDGAGRSWAYVKDGKLPEYFRDAYDRDLVVVPQRFMREVERA